QNQTRPMNDSQQATASALDHTVLAELVGDDRELLEDIVSGYREQRRELEPGMRAAPESGEHKALYAHAHKIKGTLLTMGAQRAADAAQELELAARAEDLPSCERILPALERELGEVDRAVDGIMAELDAPGDLRAGVAPK